ncbi:peptide deformylase [Lysinimonas soli]|uniref:Peptide deformylase n=1 Tax=Lysinimonas soli TaxID=1074233 RepID=A0ABW0NMM4_9MICO
MAVLPIRITGDPVLHTAARRVVDFDESLSTLVRDMEDTMAAAPGVGLAAPQVGVPLRLFVYNWRDEEGRLHRGTAINPELWISPPAVGELDEESESEGCLSIPGERFPLRRAARAILRATELDGSDYEITAEGWLARIFQHEYDHLDGLLYADRLAYPADRLMAKVIRKRSWGSPGLAWTPGIDHLED